MSQYNFPPTSRYYGIEQASLTLDDGSLLRYLRRRFLPQPQGFALLHEHVVEQGERPDLVAARELGDAEAYWRLCDANGVMHPDDLTDTVGERLRITLPEGVPGTPKA